MEKDPISFETGAHLPIHVGCGLKNALSGTAIEDDCTACFSGPDGLDLPRDRLHGSTRRRDAAIALTRVLINLIPGPLRRNNARSL